MSAHTPGPWATDGLTVYPRMILDAKIQPRICKVDSFHTGGGDRESNARLIAAAPELLEFAKWAMGQFCGDSGTGESHWEQFEEFRKGQSAIAKAESES